MCFIFQFSVCFHCQILVSMPKFNGQCSVLVAKKSINAALKFIKAVSPLIKSSFTIMFFYAHLFLCTLLTTVYHSWFTW